MPARARGLECQRLRLGVHVELRGQAHMGSQGPGATWIRKVQCLREATARKAGKLYLRWEFRFRCAAFQVVGGGARLVFNLLCLLGAGVCRSVGWWAVVPVWSLFCVACLVAEFAARFGWCSPGVRLRCLPA